MKKNELSIRFRATRGRGKYVLEYSNLIYTWRMYTDAAYLFDEIYHNSDNLTAKRLKELRKIIISESNKFRF